MLLLTMLSMALDRLRPCGVVVVGVVSLSLVNVLNLRMCVGCRASMRLMSPLEPCIWARVYDKREERVSRGFADPGPLVRVELVVSGVGATLRDVSDPSALFYHY